jgi:hypothetical protein
MKKNDWSRRRQKEPSIFLNKTMKGGIRGFDWNRRNEKA